MTLNANSSPNATFMHQNVYKDSEGDMSPT